MKLLETTAVSRALRASKGFILGYDLVIVGHESCLRPDPSVGQRILRPAIDPPGQKNMYVPDHVIPQHLRHQGVSVDKLLITQVWRFDRWKDPIDVIEVFKRVRDQVDCRIVPAGNLAADDSGGEEILLTSTRKAAGALGTAGISSS